MSARERDRLCVIEALREGRIRQAEAARRLKLSVRQVKRLVSGYRSQGARALISKRRARPSNRRIATAEREHFVELVRRRYPDFGPTLACEYLHERHGFTRSVPTLRQWMISAELWQARSVRRKRPYQLRERRPGVGELIQIDGSPHAWFEQRGPRCTLIAFVDDASGRLQYAQFVPTETSRDYLQALRSYVSLYGRPVALYSDRHSIFRKHDPEDPEPTQFERAVRSLEIEPILALSPQAKGRVERTFQTLQDRLVKALRIEGICTRERANDYLRGFIAAYNARFAKPPRSSENAHRALHLSTQTLTHITSEQHPRTLSKSLSCQYRGRLYLVQTQARAGYQLRGARVTVCDDGPDTSPVLLYKTKPLAYRVFARHDIPQRIADDKTIDAAVEQAKRRQAPPQKPAPSHPWRRPLKTSTAAGSNP